MIVEVGMLKVLVVLCMVVSLYWQACEKFIADVVKRHKSYRELHGVPDVTANATISAFAQHWANHLKETNDFAHNPNAGFNGYGENLSRMWSKANGTQQVDNLYKEEANYYANQGYCESEPNMTLFSHFGHYTQIVWKTSQQIGVGKADGTVVINYSPPGNYYYQFGDNVPCPGS